MDDLGTRAPAETGIVGGLLVRLSDDAALRAQALGELAGNAELMLGQAEGPWLPLALSAQGPRASRDLHEWILSRPGVQFVEVVAVHFEEDLEVAGPTA